MSWDPEAWLLDTLESQDIGLEYSEYVDTYDWTGEMFAQQEFATGQQKAAGTFTDQLQQLDTQVASFGFAGSFMETEAEKGIYEDFFLTSEELLTDMGQTISVSRKRYREDTYDYLSMMITDMEILDTDT